jgi:hypothetical protein
MTYEQYEMYKEQIHELIVADYFSKHWVGSTLQFEKSGMALVDKINELKPKTVLDVGCGYNLYRDKIKCDLFVGIDPYNDNATFKQSITDFASRATDQQFDVVMVLGSINFGSSEKIMEEFDAVDKLTKKGGHIFVRVNPGITHTHTDYPLINLIEFYPWTKQAIQTMADIHGYQILELEEETNRSGDKRLFFHYYK